MSDGMSPSEIHRQARERVIQIHGPEPRGDELGLAICAGVLSYGIVVLTLMLADVPESRSGLAVNIIPIAAALVTYLHRRGRSTAWYRALREQERILRGE